MSQRVIGRKGKEGHGNLSSSCFLRDPVATHIADEDKGEGDEEDREDEDVII